MYSLYTQMKAAQRKEIYDTKDRLTRFTQIARAPLWSKFEHRMLFHFAQMMNVMGSMYIQLEGVTDEYISVFNHALTAARYVDETYAKALVQPLTVRQLTKMAGEVNGLITEILTDLRNSFNQALLDDTPGDDWYTSQIRNVEALGIHCGLMYALHSYTHESHVPHLSKFCRSVLRTVSQDLKELDSDLFDAFGSPMVSD